VLATISACNIRDFSIFLREPEMLLFAYRDITAWISRPTPLKWPETPSRVTDFTTLAKSARGDRRALLFARAICKRWNERGSDWLQDRSGGNFAFGRTPSLSYPTLFCRSANHHYPPN
jgi:L-rhamnose mutarotase